LGAAVAVTVAADLVHHRIRRVQAVRLAESNPIISRATSSVVLVTDIGAATSPDLFAEPLIGINL
jgi:hypothetical protein